MRPRNPVFRPTARLTMEAAGTVPSRPMAFFQSDGLTVFLHRTSPGGLSLLCLQACHAFVIFPRREPRRGVLGSQGQRKHQSKIAFSQNHPKKKIPVSLTQLSQLFLKQWFWLESAPRDKQTRLLHTRQIRVGSEAVADYNEIISIELEAWVCLVDFFASKPRHEMVGNHRQAHQRGNQNGTWHFN